MTASERPTTGDEARATVAVALAPARAFHIFTAEIDQWWRRGVKYRASASNRGIIHLEPRVGGRLLESIDDGSGRCTVIESGRITAWEPPHRFVFDWRNQNFAPSERTEVEVLFRSQGTGTLVTVIHRGWSSLPADHPARHGLAAGPYLRSLGLWWGDLLSSLRELAEARHDAP